MAIQVSSILTSNALGHLTKDHLGGDIVQDEFLPPGKYFWHPVGPSQSSSPHSKLINYSSVYADAKQLEWFWEWELPNELPPEWSTIAYEYPRYRYSATRTVAKERDGKCVISGDPDVLELAHLVPKAEQAKFDNDKMDRFIIPGAAPEPKGDKLGRPRRVLEKCSPRNGRSFPDSRGIDNPSNLILMEPYSHQALDRAFWDPLPHDGGFIAALAVHPTSSVLYERIHDKQIHLKGISPHFLYTRAAWNVFKRHKKGENWSRLS